MEQGSGVVPNRYGHTAVVHDGAMWVFGGVDEDNTYANSVYVYHFGTYQHLLPSRRSPLVL